MNIKIFIAGSMISITALLTQNPAIAEQPTTIKRTSVSSNEIQPAKPVSTVQVTRLEFAPEQQTGTHMHPVPVIGYVLEGDFVIKIQGQDEQHFTTGQTIYEPANIKIEKYDNASKTERGVVIATYLLNSNDHEVIKFLPAEKE